ncbi:MAG: hypothetical protein FIB01_08240 [Gemmatimonadetes bacterium]|nr:hypothetical protein [Gemmatimonadota bacterium]
MPRYYRYSALLLPLAVLALAACDDKGPASPPDDKPGAAAAVAIAAGDGQRAAPGAPVADSLTVRVADAKGRAVAGAVVTWTVASGGGTLSNSSSVTAATGQARVQWTLGLGEGAQTVTASVGALTPVTFTATGTVTATGTGTIAGAGGIIGLSDGTRVIFPAGAVPAGTQVSVAQEDPATFFDGTDQTQRVVLSFTSSVTDFAQDVEIRVPLPTGMTEADSARVYAGVIHMPAGVVRIAESTVKQFGGRPYIVVRTRRFAPPAANGPAAAANAVSLDRDNWALGWGPVPPSSAQLVLPYYSQGSTPFCAAVSLQILTRAVNNDDLNTVPQAIGMIGADESGVSGWEWLLLPSIGTVVKGRTGVKPTRTLWTAAETSALKEYLKREIGVNGRPVLLHTSGESHALVVAGYRGDTFVLHNPASTYAAVGYTDSTWTAMNRKQGALSNFVTVVIPKAITARSGWLSVNIIDQALGILRPALGPGDPTTSYRSRWDYTQSQGYSFRDGNVRVDPLPGTVATFTVPGELQLANSSLTDQVNASVWLDITAVGAPAGEGHYAVRGDVTIGANRTANFKPASVPVDTFRYNRGTATQYQATVSALVNNTLVDRQSLQFSIASVTPVLTAVVPAAADVGGVVELRGSQLGSSRYHNRVDFNGVEATQVVGWQNDLVRVKVPQNATSGSVRLWRGDVPSNPLPFTVQEYRTSQGFELGWGKATENVQVNVSIAVEAASDGAGWRTVFEERSAFDPQQWVRLYFGTKAPPAGGASTYRVTVDVKDFATTVHQGDLSFVRAYWVVRSQTPNGLPTTTIQGSTLNITEEASVYAKQADLFLVFQARNPQTGDVDYFEDSAGFGISFSPSHVGMR